MLTYIKSKARKIELLQKIWRIINRLINRITQASSKRIYSLDLRQEKPEPLEKRALFSYIVHPFSISNDNPSFHRHINIWHAQEIVMILNELGYLVDVIDYRDEKYIPSKNYNLFIGHGGFNFGNISNYLDENALKIYFTAGNYWKFRNKANSARFDALKERKGVRLPPDRLQTPAEEKALLIADGVIGIGSDFSRKTYEGFSPVIMVNVNAMYDDHYEQEDKDFEKGKEHFLYFAGQGNVHKGLDLLLDAFGELEQNLWICSYIDKEFEEVYKEELYNHPNIHLVGPVMPRSDTFYRIMDTCNFAILPSCSEGQPHSIVECMNQGVIPIVSLPCGLNVSQYGELLDPCTIDEIKRVVRKLSGLTASKCKELSVKARETVKRDFSEFAFHKNMKNGLLDIISCSKSIQPDPSNRTIINPVFVDEHQNVVYFEEAIRTLKKDNDLRYYKEGQGIVEVNQLRWENAQRYERRTWMEAGGLKRREDRNKTHKEGFGNYLAIKGRHFRNGIELGCGPFTNMQHIIKEIHCEKIALLDPLIEDYLKHPYCTYKGKRLGRWFGKKVETIALPVEDYLPEEQFDLIVIINVLEHCFSVSKIFEHILSITAPKGVIVFHDKLIAEHMIHELVHKVYDTGHPLRISESIIKNFLSKNYHELFLKKVPTKTAFSTLDTLYFIGEKRDSNIEREIP